MAKHRAQVSLGGIGIGLATRLQRLAFESGLNLRSKTRDSRPQQRIRGFFSGLPARQTSSCKILSARSISSRRNSFSLSGASSGFPVGLTIPPEAMARSEPTSFATGIIVQICATGISSRSISLLIAAPQRVLEPHVEVRMTPCTPAAFKRAAICLPMLVAFSTAA